MTAAKGATDCYRYLFVNAVKASGHCLRAWGIADSSDWKRGLYESRTANPISVA
jgi:hypothetical protein